LSFSNQKLDTSAYKQKTDTTDKITLIVPDQSTEPVIFRIGKKGARPQKPSVNINLLLTRDIALARERVSFLIPLLYQRVQAVFEAFKVPAQDRVLDAVVGLDDKPEGIDRIKPIYREAILKTLRSEGVEIRISNRGQYEWRLIPDNKAG
jgi:hypothetical protein